MIECGRILTTALFFWPFNATTRGLGGGAGEKGAEKDATGEEVAILQAGTWD